MVITASVLLIGLLLLIRPLQKNSFYLLHCGIVILAAYYIETHYFRVTPFAPKTLLLFLVYQFISINLVTFLAYWVDKRAAVRGAGEFPSAICMPWKCSAAGAAHWPGRKFCTIRTRKRVTAPNLRSY